LYLAEFTIGFAAREGALRPLLMRRAQRHCHNFHCRGLAIKLTRLYWIDPAMSLVIFVVIAIGTWGLLRESIRCALQAVPEGVDLEKVENYLAALPNVTAVHDLDVWPMSTTQTALTAHLEMPNDSSGDEFLHRVSQHLHDEFQIEHCTIQIEQCAEACSLAPEHTA
jgi:cobalt-zinc-cadmium efflux system protein